MSEVDLIEVTCPRCQKHLRVSRDQAGKRVRCSNPSCTVMIEVPSPSAVTEAAAGRYPILKLLGVLYLVLAVVCLLGALGGVIFGLTRAISSQPILAELIAAGVAVVIGLIGCVSCLAFAEFIKLALDIESYTRSTNALLARMREAGPTERA